LRTAPAIQAAGCLGQRTLAAQCPRLARSIGEKCDEATPALLFNRSFGVANAQIIGGQTFAMRVWLNPDRRPTEPPVLSEHPVENGKN
jgi:hypothetical protein